MKKALVVEDEFSSRLIMQKLLEEHAQVHIAINAEEAIEACKIALEADDYYDLICLDIQMPGLNGNEALKHLRQLEIDAQVPPGKEARIIMTTAMNDSSIIMKTFRDQSDAYLIKPITKAVLEEKLKALKLI
jgi:two-component system chemotaxis response regulator CheY